MTRLLTILISGLTLAQSCKKEDPVPEPAGYQPNVAPCEIEELVYPVDSIFYGPGEHFSEARFRVKFADPGDPGHNLEFAFNRIPVTGMYHMVTYIDTNSLELSNQVASYTDSGSYSIRSAQTEDAVVYIENNSDELIISFCNMNNQFVFNPQILSYIGNPSERKVRKQY